ncbi:uncharacterized protein LOC107366554 [Tetranychus urticae]|uniref:Uncharacterized protein n=1 Tax=Tetranychus urticae TaxID=32264 RepID=T1KQX8_TETUR|nr:uncharacterized protein LOC107366554 [Tetranychus urticae]
MVPDYIKDNWQTLLSYAFASIGLVWQVSSISKVYFNYETQVDISIGVSTKIAMPGLTVCLEIDQLSFGNATRQDIEIAAQFLSQSSVSSLNYLTKYEYSYLPINLLANFASPDIKLYCNVPATELPRLNTSLDWTCGNIVPTKITIHYMLITGTIARCVTYFYQDSAGGEFDVFTNSAKDFYVLKIDTFEPKVISIYVHNPSQINQISDADTITFSTGELNEIVLLTSKFVTLLLPPPYRTACRSYDEFEFGRLGCIFDCFVKETNKRCPVWSILSPANVSVALPFMRKVSESNGTSDCHVKEKNFCFSVCSQPECKGVYYTTTNVYLSERRSLANSNSTLVYVRRPSGVEFGYKYKARLAPIEFFCYLASCLSLWYGISFINFYRFLTGWLRNNLISFNFISQQTQVQSPSQLAAISNKPSSINNMKIQYLHPYQPNQNRYFNKNPIHYHQPSWLAEHSNIRPKAPQISTLRNKWSPLSPQRAVYDKKKFNLSSVQIYSAW